MWPALSDYQIWPQTRFPCLYSSCCRLYNTIWIQSNFTVEWSREWSDWLQSSVKSIATIMKQYENKWMYQINRRMLGAHCSEKAGFSQKNLSLLHVRASALGIWVKLGPETMMKPKATQHLYWLGHTGTAWDVLWFKTAQSKTKKCVLMMLNFSVWQLDLNSCVPVFFVCFFFWHLVEAVEM